MTRSDLHLGELERVGLFFPLIPVDSFERLFVLAVQVETGQLRLLTLAALVPPCTEVLVGAPVVGVPVWSAELRSVLMNK